MIGQGKCVILFYCPYPLIIASQQERLQISALQSLSNCSTSARISPNVQGANPSLPKGSCVRVFRLSQARSTLMWEGGDPLYVPAVLALVSVQLPGCVSSCRDMCPAGFGAGERGWDWTGSTQTSVGQGRLQHRCPLLWMLGGSGHHPPPVLNPLLPEHRLSWPNPGAGAVCWARLCSGKRRSQTDCSGDDF